MEQNKYYEENEISLKELIEVIWKGKFLIIILTVVFFVLALAGSLVYDRMESEVGTVVSMQWNGISQGEYPDGSRFEYSEAFEPYVFTLALAETGMDLDTNDVRDAFSIQPIVPSSVLALIQQSIEDGGDPISYYATNYKVMLNNGDLGITVDEARTLMNEIINQFRDDFDRQYINSVNVYDFTDTAFEDYDYLDAFDILEAQVELVNNAMEERTDSGFYSPSLGISFNDILVRTSLLTRVELNQIQSRTNSYLLTKDVDFLITNYTFKIEQLEIELAKATAKETDIQLLIDNYTGSTQTILIPGMSDTQTIEIDTYYNTLVENQITLQSDIADYTEDIAYYELLIDRLNGDDPTFTVTPAKQAEEIVKVEANIAAADLALESIVNDANIILTEYNAYITSNIIKPLMAPEYQSNVNVMLYSAVGLVLGGMVGVVTVLGKHFWKTAK